jgi:polysaccharide biosynthesis/export protein
VRWVAPESLGRFSDEPWIAPGGGWDRYAQGEYVGRARMAHVSQYRLRVDDQMDMVYRQTRKVTSKPYRLTPGDEIRIHSISRPNDINSERILVQPDGMISLPLIGQAPAAGLTIAQLSEALDERYQKYFPAPTIGITPLRLNVKVLDLIDAVDRRYGAGGGQGRSAVITPDGTLALPDIGSVPAQGLTLPELEVELNERYNEKLEGVFVNPILTRRAARYVYVMGEVHSPGRYELLAPTTASQAVSLAGSWRVGANLRHIIVLRRDDRWQLMGCVVNLSDVLCRDKRCPRDDIWISDSDVVIVPKSTLLRADDAIEMIFTRGIYGVFPLNATLNFNKLSTI